jgi:hypothetical protein
MARPCHAPTPIARRAVRSLAGAGVAHVEIAEVVGIARMTLEKYYRAELAAGSSQVETDHVRNLMRLAKGRNRSVALRATMFVLQARFGWTRYAPAADDEWAGLIK